MKEKSKGAYSTWDNRNNFPTEVAWEQEPERCTGVRQVEECKVTMNL